MSSPSCRLICFGRDSRAATAVEFALILPVLLILYLGSFDAFRGVTMGRKAGLGSEAVSQLVALQSTTTPLTGGQVGSIIAASTATIAPYDTAPLKTTVSAIDLKTRANGTCCDATVRWSFTQAGTLRPCSVTLTQVVDGATPTPTTIPASIATPSSAVITKGTAPTAVILADVSYSYTPIAPLVQYLNITTVKRSTYAFPRNGGQVTLASPVATTSGQSGTVCS